MPFRSKAQLRAAFGGHIPGFTRAKALQWARETPSIADLPERVRRNAARCSDEYIDNENGAGSTGNNGNIDYLGLRVRMLPHVFRSLASPLTRKEADTAEGLKAFVLGGGRVGSPMLYLDIPEGWSKGDFSEAASVNGHEGRNRMFAFEEICGRDEMVEVHIIPGSRLREYRARHLTPEIVSAMQHGIRAQSGSRSVQGRLVPGPLFVTERDLAPNRSSRRKSSKNSRRTSRKR